MCKNCAFYVKTRSCCHFAILLPYQNLLCINNFCKVAAIAAKNKNIGSSYREKTSVKSVESVTSVVAKKGGYAFRVAYPPLL